MTAIRRLRGNLRRLRQRSNRADVWQLSQKSAWMDFLYYGRLIFSKSGASGPFTAGAHALALFWGRRVRRPRNALRQVRGFMLSRARKFSRLVLP